MSVGIGSNISAMISQRNLSNNNRDVNDSMRAITSGSRVSRASDDPASFAISESLRGQLAGVKQASFNAQNAQSMMQTAEGALNQQNNILIRLRELSVQGASDTLGDKERELIDVEFQQLNGELSRIAESTRFGNNSLLNGESEAYEFQVGPNGNEHDVIAFNINADTTAEGLNMDDIEVTDQSGAIDALTNIDSAMEKLSGVRAKFGAFQSRLNHTIDNLGAQSEGLEQARSTIADTDVAEEMSKLTQSQIKQDMSTAMLAMSNQNAQRVLSLLG